MKALVTGAGSGIGRDMARYLSKLGFDLIIVGRDKEKLEKLQSELKTNIKIVVIDLANESRVKELYVLTKNDDIDVLVNNAGFGALGEFDKTDLNVELEMIDTNIKAVHILTKMFLKDMKRRNHGYILNVASSAAFQPGPLMATYYSTKTYVLHLTLAIYEELRRSKSSVHVSCLCPGPVKTNFNNVAGVKSNLKSLSSEYVAKYAIEEMFNGKLVIIPGLKIKILSFFNKFLSYKSKLKIIYRVQKKKQGKKNL